ncbi:MAG: Na+/H+ antiporter subunit B [Chloroflexi bacterium]|nr:Na+/H+ antiporter subunit B [Chloroflexota bacterium]
MDSVVLRTATRYLLPLLLLFSVFALLRGHNEPGGGFVGGLVAATAFALYAVGYGVAAARQLLQTSPRRLIGIGLLVAASSGLIGMAWGDPFLTARWDTREIPVVGKLGTPLLFDIGVYLVVIGVALTIIFALIEAEEEA